jgi:hypothetical protein
VLLESNAKLMLVPQNGRRLAVDEDGSARDFISATNSPSAIVSSTPDKASTERFPSSGNDLLTLLIAIAAMG